MVRMTGIRLARACVALCSFAVGGAFVHGCSDDTTEEEETEIPPSQGPSERCDPDLGLDACGAGLFCAAFDGRKIDTCYAEHSRLVGESCREDRHCVTSSCVEKKCRGTGAHAAPCASNADCASDYCYVQSTHLCR